MPFVYGFLCAVLLTPAVSWAARRFGIVDLPDGGRKKHGGPIPLLGGIAIFAALAIALAFSWDRLVGGFLPPKHLLGILAGGLILVIGGSLDDRWRLRPVFQIAFPIMAALVVIASGIGADEITNPLGGVFRLDQWHWTIFEAGGVPYQLTLPADLFTFVWLMMMMYTTKFLDGVDGVTTGLGVIGATVLAFLSLSPEVGQPELARVAAAVTGAFAGFLMYNASPASIFLGEGGSTLIGYLLGVMAILAGGKIGITLLVLAVPFMDVFWTVFRRLVLDHKPVTSGDRGHLHQRLLDSGLSPAATTLVFWAFAAAFGGVGLFLEGAQKVLALAGLAAAFVVVSFLLRPRS